MASILRRELGPHPDQQWPHCCHLVTFPSTNVINNGPRFTSSSLQLPPPVGSPSHHHIHAHRHQCTGYPVPILPSWLTFTERTQDHQPLQLNPKQTTD